MKLELKNIAWKYEVLAFKPYNPKCESDAHIAVVLVRLEKPEHPFVTWVCDKNTGECYWGSYHETLGDAQARFNKRGAGECAS